MSANGEAPPVAARPAQARPTVARPTYARTGQRCTPPAAGDAAVGLIVLVLPLLAPVIWLGDDGTTATRGWLVAFAIAYAMGAIVALHGLTSDASPLRMSRAYVPMRFLLLACIYAVGLPWGVAMVVAPGSIASQEAAQRGEILPSPGATASTASDGSTIAPPPPSQADLWVASGATVPIGRVVMMLAVLSLLVVFVMYVVARREQLALFPKPGPFDVAGPFDALERSGAADRVDPGADAGTGAGFVTAPSGQVEGGQADKREGTDEDATSSGAPGESRDPRPSGD